MAVPTVFISYSSKDLKIAEKIENYLLANQFSVWWDKSNIRDDWSKEIVNALSKSDIILVIWSENSSKSDWVKNEWLTARALSKPIKIVIISNLKYTLLPKPLENTESIVFENDNIDSDIQKMSEGLKRNTQSLHKDHDYNILPPKRHMPLDSNPNFTGRDKELVDLYLEIIGDLNKH